MMPSDLARMRGILDARHNELEDLLLQGKAHAVKHGVDMVDQVQHTAARDLAMYTLEFKSARLREVQSRMHLGTFGICVDCEEEISLKRLAAVPWTALCIVCQEASDRSPNLAPQLQRLSNP